MEIQDRYPMKKMICLFNIYDAIEVTEILFKKAKESGDNQRAIYYQKYLIILYNEIQSICNTKQTNISQLNTISSRL